MEDMQPWFIYAFLGALAAGLVSVFAKRGMEGIAPNLATAVRSGVMTLFLVGVVTVQGLWDGTRGIGGRSMGWIALSGVAGAVSWLFMFKALSLAPVSRVGPVDKLSMPLGILLAVLVLGERPSWVNWAGIGLITVGAYLATLPQAR